MSIATTSLPESDKHAAVTRPTYPVPITATFMTSLPQPKVVLTLRARGLFISRSEMITLTLCPPIFQRIFERLIERNLRFPAGVLPQFAGINAGDRRVARAQTLLTAHLGAAAGQRQEPVEHVAQPPFGPAGDVVGLAFPSLLQQQDISTCHIAHVGEIADSAQIAGVDHRRLPAALDGRDLAGEARDGVVGRLSRPDMVQRPDAHDIKARMPRILKRR